MPTSFGTNFMWAAYAAVWLIHGGYLLYLRSESRKLKAEMAEVAHSESRRG